LGFRAWASGLGLQGLGFRAWASGLGLQGLGFRAWASGLGKFYLKAKNAFFLLKSAGKTPRGPTGAEKREILLVASTEVP
jgi:hypothetical protein